MREAIIDHATLVNLTELSERLGASFDAVSQLRILYTKVHIPEEVKNEYERYAALSPYRQALLARLRPDEGFLSLCTHYDSIRKAIIQTERLRGIDEGEAEAIAQAEKIRVYTFLTDDARCIETVEQRFSHIRCYNTVFILAALDLNGFLKDRDQYFATLLKIRPFKSSELREAYLRAAGHYGFRLDKKTLSHKSSIKRLRGL